MELSTQVAYRYYKLKGESKAIAFNTKTRNYMFLDGLSADLLNNFLENQDITSFMEANGLALEDINWFKGQLSNFGFFYSCREDVGGEYSTNIIEDEPKDYSKELASFMKSLSDNGLYYSFQLDLTNRCNEKCIHCYHPFEKYDYSKEMSTLDIKNLVDDIYNLGVFSVTLSGGECLTRKDFLEILKYISDKGMLTSIYTNGTLLNENIASYIKNCRVETVSISIYGANAEIHDSVTGVEGSFQRTINGINILNKYSIPIGLKCVLLSKNIQNINDIRNLTKQLNNGQECRIEYLLSGKVDGDCSVFAYRASELDIGKAYLSITEQSLVDDIIAVSLDSVPCGAGKYGLYCSADGKIYPCVAFRLYLCEYKYLKDIHNNSILKKWLKVRLSDFSDCQKHEYCKYCFRTCAGDNLVENGNYLDSTNVASCRQAKAVFELLK